MSPAPKQSTCTPYDAYKLNMEIRKNKDMGKLNDFVLINISNHLPKMYKATQLLEITLHQMRSNVSTPTTNKGQSFDNSDSLNTRNLVEYWLTKAAISVHNCV